MRRKKVRPKEEETSVRSDEKKSRVQPKGKKPSIKKIVAWVGSLCGIAIAALTIYEKSTAPSPPKLTVTFFESSSNTLNLFPSVDTSVEQTEDIPLQLKIENHGGKTAKNTKLYISHYANVVLTAQYQKEEKRTWNAPNEAMKQLSLTLEDINPGESFLIPIVVKLDFPRDFQDTLRRPKQEVRDKKLLLPRGFPIYCDLSADGFPSTRNVLQIVLGNLEVLREQNQDIYWIGHGADGVRVLKMKEDYPAH